MDYIKDDLIKCNYCISQGFYPTFYEIENYVGTVSFKCVKCGDIIYIKCEHCDESNCFFKKFSSISLTCNKIIYNCCECNKTIIEIPLIKCDTVTITALFQKIIYIEECLKRNNII